MPDELREKTAYEYRKWNPSASIGRALEFADSILSLIDEERCVWTYTDGGYETSCDSWLFQEQAIHPHCPDCGKRIEVKDGQ